jgi:hypothetical protein
MPRRNMGFGMMVPDWFIEDAMVVPQGPVWHTHKYDATSVAYEPTVFNTKSSPDGKFIFEYRHVATAATIFFTQMSQATFHITRATLLDMGI